MKRTEMLQVRVAAEIKSNATLVLERMGLTVGEAVNVFLHQVINTKSIPFEIKITPVNEEREKQIDTLLEKLAKSEAEYKKTGKCYTIEEIQADLELI